MTLVWKPMQRCTRILGTALASENVIKQVKHSTVIGEHAQEILINRLDSEKQIESENKMLDTYFKANEVYRDPIPLLEKGHTMRPLWTHAIKLCNKF